jgi:hypothetical protein
MVTADRHTTNGKPPFPPINVSSVSVRHIQKTLSRCRTGDLFTFCLYILTFWILFCSQKILKKRKAFFVVEIPDSFSLSMLREKNGLVGSGGDFWLPSLDKGKFIWELVFVSLNVRYAPAGFPCCLPLVGQTIESRMIGWWWIMNWKDVVVADLRYYVNICWNRPKNSQKTSIKTVLAPVEIRTRHLLDYVQWIGNTRKRVSGVILSYFAHPQCPLKGGLEFCLSFSQKYFEL